MKRFSLLLAALFLLIPTSLSAQSRIRHAEWNFIRQNKGDATGADFLKEGRYASTTGDDAWIRFETENKLAKPNLTKKSEPICSNTQKGDCWIFEMPVEEFEKGSIIDIWCPFHSYPTGTGHRFAVEYRDGKKWLPTSAHRKSLPPNIFGKVSACKRA